MSATHQDAQTHAPQDGRQQDGAEYQIQQEKLYASQNAGINGRQRDAIQKPQESAEGNRANTEEPIHQSMDRTDQQAET